MKSNRFSDTVREYVRRLNDDDLQYLQMRLFQRIGSDVAEAIELIQRNSDMDHWLGLSKNANDLFDMIDSVDLSIQNESRRRFAVHEKAR